MSSDLGSDPRPDSNATESGQFDFRQQIIALDPANEPESVAQQFEQWASQDFSWDAKSSLEFLNGLAENNELLKISLTQKPLDAVFRKLSTAIRNALIREDKDGQASSFDERWQSEAKIDEVYRNLPMDSHARNQLLACLANLFSESAHRMFADLIVTDPPSDEKAVLVAFSPLVNSRKKYSVEPLFPKLLEALKYKHLAAIILDLCNYCFREGLVDTNPASKRVEQLTQLLGQVVSQLELIEEGQVSGQSPQQISDNVNESVALTVSLCDTIALSDHVQGVGKIRQAMSLKHRRVKTEAAAALVRLGDTDEKEGEKLLVDLASEPICRLRAIAYAQELGLSEQIDDKFLAESATAESQLAIWLAAPSQMGVAPTAMELIYQNKLRWPGFDVPVDCFLFRFEYRFAGQAYSNIGISGPITHAFPNNLEHLSELEILSAYAGWQTQHEDIYSVEFERAQQALPGVTESLLHRLRGQYDQFEPLFVGFFFETPALVGRVMPKDDRDTGSIAISDRQNDFVYPCGSAQSPITAELAFDIYKGRQLLHAFNDFDE